MKVLGGSRKESSKYLRVQGAVPVYNTGETAAGGFGGKVWVLISGVCAHGPFSGRPDRSVVLHNRVAYAVVT